MAHDSFQIGSDAFASTGCVLVVDDDQQVRDSLTGLFASAGYQTRGFADGQQFIDGYRPGGPACLILDVRLPGMSGLVLLERLAALGLADLPVVMLTGHGDVPMAVRAMKHGVVDFFQKPANEQQLLDAVVVALEQHAAALGARERNEELANRVRQLSRREMQVLRLAVRGLSNRAIGDELGISQRTVERHRYSALRRLGVGSTVEAALLLPNV